MIFPNGRLLWLTALLIVPACALQGTAPGLRLYAYAVVFGCVILFGIDAYRGYMRLSRIQLSAPAFLKVFKGRRSSLVLQILNLPLVCGTISLPELATSAELQSPSGLEVFFVPARRGAIRVDAGEIEAPSPWKLWRITSRKPLKTEVRVLPDLARDPTAKLLLAARTGGMRTQRLTGRGREFERVRDYAPGDSYDEIAWKATARRSKPVVRVLQVERTQDIYAIVDSSRLSARNDAAEEFVTAALSMALATENAGDNFGLITFSDRVKHFLPAVRGRAHFARCRDALFDLGSGAGVS